MRHQGSSWYKIQPPTTPTNARPIEDKLRAATDRLQQQLVSKVIYKEESIHDEKKLVRDLEALTATRLELNRNLTVTKNEAPGCRKV